MHRWVLGVAWLAISGCDDLCGGEVWKTVRSPDGERMAVVYERDCGATTSAAVNVTVVPAREGFKPKEKGDVMIADDGHHPAVSLQVEPRWEGNDRLTLVHDPGLRFFARATSAHGVAVSYQPAAR